MTVRRSADEAVAERTEPVREQALDGEAGCVDRRTRTAASAAHRFRVMTSAAAKPTSRDWTVPRKRISADSKCSPRCKWSIPWTANTTTNTNAVMRSALSDFDAALRRTVRDGPFMRLGIQVRDQGGLGYRAIRN